MTGEEIFDLRGDGVDWSDIVRVSGEKRTTLNKRLVVYCENNGLAFPRCRAKAVYMSGTRRATRPRWRTMPDGNVSPAWRDWVARLVRDEHGNWWDGERRVG
ncbi:MAG: hypothetical protein B7733_12950 [Myxococcales bacterium FL481]|nr:MAG: hypothetical protein B7733_12950 [Myxococcales bacterium FL481]